MLRWLGGWSLVIALAAAPQATLGSQLWGGAGPPTRIDQQTGALLNTISYGGPYWRDTASDPVREPTLVWGVTGFGANELTALNPLTGHVASSVELNSGAGVLPAVQSIAISPTTGELFGATSEALYRLNRATGERTLVGVTSASLTKALGFAADGTLYGIASENVLVSVDTQTAAITTIGALGLHRVEDLAARPEDGVMFALAYTQQSYQLITIDVSAATFEYLGPSSIRPSYLAFTGVPEAGSQAAMVMAIVAAVIGRQRFAVRSR